MKTGLYYNYASCLVHLTAQLTQSQWVNDSWLLVKLSQPGGHVYVPSIVVVVVAIKRKNNAYKKYRINKSHYNEYKYRTQRNIATNEVRKAKQSFEQKIAKECQKNPKAFWRYIKSKTVPKSNIGNLKYNGKVAETDIEKAEILTHF